MRLYLALLFLGVLEGAFLVFNAACTSSEVQQVVVVIVVLESYGLLLPALVVAFLGGLAETFDAQVVQLLKDSVFLLNLLRVRLRVHVVVEVFFVEHINYFTIHLTAKIGLIVCT